MGLAMCGDGQSVLRAGLRDSPAECGTVGKYDVERDTGIMITSG